MRDGLIVFLEQQLKQSIAIYKNNKEESQWNCIFETKIKTMNKKEYETAVNKPVINLVCLF